MIDELTTFQPSFFMTVIDFTPINSVANSQHSSSFGKPTIILSRGSIKVQKSCVSAIVTHVVKLMKDPKSFPIGSFEENDIDVKLSQPEIDQSEVRGTNSFCFSLSPFGIRSNQ